MTKFTDIRGNQIDIDAARIRSIRSFTYGPGRATVTRIEYDGGDTENVLERVEIVQGMLEGEHISFMRLHDIRNAEFLIVGSKVRNIRPITYGLSHTTVTRLEYADGDKKNVVEDLETVRSLLQPS